MTVPIHAVMLINPAMDTSAPIVGYIIGQAAPSILSGKPSEIKDIYMTTNKSIETIFPPIFETPIMVSSYLSFIKARVPGY